MKQDHLNPHLLVSDVDLSIALPGATVKSFRGETLTLVQADWSAPPSTGRIYVSEPGKHARIESYYPSVCNLRWMTADGWKEKMLADGCPEEAIEEMLAEAIAALIRKPYNNR